MREREGGGRGGGRERGVGEGGWEREGGGRKRGRERAYCSFALTIKVTVLCRMCIAVCAGQLRDENASMKAQLDSVTSVSIYLV